MEDRKNEISKPHSIKICEREEIVITGVEEVESFDEREIVLFTERGNLVLEGEDFKINALSVETGDMEISGFLVNLRYNENAKSGGGFWSKIFK